MTMPRLPEINWTPPVAIPVRCTCKSDKGWDIHYQDGDGYAYCRGCTRSIKLTTDGALWRRHRDGLAAMAERP